ncbi:hypothetical protein QYF36_022524 [Acer negundo]|nr:hypothetical protein QYF36_022524 [Acer negundo]
MRNIFTLANKSPKPWNTKRKPQHRSSLLFLLITLFTFTLVFLAYTNIPKSLLSISSSTTQNPKFPQCHQTLDQKFLFYSPHSGFSNQLQEFKNAILMAAILNRTLIIPPVLDHHAVALGSCPKFRVSTPTEIRITVWDHVIDLLRTGRYVSIADIVDISSLVSSSAVQVIDFRVFASLWCGIDIDLACLNEVDIQSSLISSLKQCGSVLSGVNGNIDKCLYAVDEDCKTTVWTYQSGDEDGLLDSFQADEQLKKKKKISYTRRRRDIYNALGSGSAAEMATVLAFGSLFTSPYKGSELYIDIKTAPKNQRIQSLIRKIEFIPFVPEILNSGKKYALETIKAPFLCAQLRLLDGQFKNHWKATFTGLKQKLDSLSQKGPQPIHIFVMTDLPESNWTGSYLGDLAKHTDYFKLYFLKEENELVVQTAKKLATSGHDMRYGSTPSSVVVTGMKKHCPRRFSDLLLYIEESICSCASLGFVGTAGSTIAESIQLMRKFDVCSGQT